MLSISILVVFIAFSLIVSTEEHIFRRLRDLDYTPDRDEWVENGDFSAIESEMIIESDQWFSVSIVLSMC